MTSAEVKKAVLEMSPEERLEIIRTAWESFTTQEEVPPSAEELAFIDERIRDYEANPEDVVPWEEVKAKLWPRL